MERVNQAGKDEDRMERIVDQFLFEDTHTKEQQRKIKEKKYEATLKMEKAILTREEKVNPKIAEILRTHYGVDFEKAAAGNKCKKKIGTARKSKEAVQEELDNLYKWAQERDQRVEKLAEDLHEEVMEQCPFVPAIANKSRQIYDNNKKKILTDRKRRQEELEKKREETEAEKLNDKTKEKGIIAEKKMNNIQADTFHKHMMDWCDKKEKNMTKKTVEHWIDTFENPDVKKNIMITQDSKNLRTKVLYRSTRNTRRTMPKA